MEKTPHLQPVETTPGRRAAPRQRPSHSLPTDRMKMTVQVNVLQTLGRLSGTNRKPVSVELLGQAVNEVSRHTVGLSNNFFVEMGWLEKAGRGEYAASKALVLYTMKRANNPGDTAAAVVPLREAAEKSWAWECIRPMLVNGSAAVTEVRLALMQEAGAGQDHLPQLTNLFEWLHYVRLIRLASGQVFAAESGATSSVTPAPASSPDGRETAVDAAPAVAKEQRATPAGPATAGTSAPVVVSLAFSLQLTADDLATLSSDQITSLFAGVGALAAVKNVLNG